MVACQKAPQRACWKATGTIENLSVPLADFQYLVIHPHIQVSLLQDSLNYIEWQAGHNLMSFLAAEVKDDTLALRNKNTCRFLRYQNGKVKVVVHFTSLKELHLANSEQVSSAGKWTQDELLIYMREGVGLVDLKLAVQKLVVRNNYGWQALRLSGQAKSFFVDLDGSAAVDAKNLSVKDSISFRSSSLLTSYISADQILLKAQLYGSGDLFYAGNPSVLLQTAYGSGKVKQQ